MKMLTDKKTYFLTLALGAVLLPYPAFAANVYLETARTQFFVGDTILVDVKVDSEDKEINIVEGNISLSYPPNAVFVRDISLSGSSFSLWPNRPSLSEDLKTISFVGGVPSGLRSDDATLFKIALNLENAGQIVLNPADIAVYLNDGRGTRDLATARNLTINVLAQEAGYKPVNDLEALLSGDKTPPKSFEILLGQDNSIFEGKKFLSFGTIDEQSGIKYYEVREGGLPPVRSSGTYVLQNQDDPVEVTVVAYDGAGNARESVYSPAPYNLAYLIIVALVLLAGVVIYRRRASRI